MQQMRRLISSKPKFRFFSTATESREVWCNWAQLRYEPTKTHTQNPPVQLRKLQNGLKLVSYPALSPTASISLAIHSGTRKENFQTIGTTQFLKHFSFKDNLLKYGLQIVRDLEAVGGTMTTVASREALTYHLEGTNRQSFIDVAVQTLRSVVVPEFREWTMKLVQKSLKQEALENQSDPIVSLLDGVHREAFRNQGLGNPLAIPSYAAHNVDVRDLVEYSTDNFVGSNATLVGRGIDLESLIAIGHDLYLTKGNSDYHPNSYSAEYVGGEIRLPASKADTHLLLVHEGASLKDLKSQISSYILQNVLGSGSQWTLESFPGTGTSGRLSRQLLESHPWILRAAAINQVYYDTGLFGVYVQAKSGHAAELTSGVSSVINRLNDLSDAEVSRAKALTKGNFLRSVENSNDYLAEFLGRWGTLDKAFSPGDYVKEIDNISRTDISEFVKKFLEKKPTVGVVGDVWGVPKF